MAVSLVESMAEKMVGSKVGYLAAQMVVKMADTMVE